MMNRSQQVLSVVEGDCGWGRVDRVATIGINNLEGPLTDYFGLWVALFVLNGLNELVDNEWNE